MTNGATIFIATPANKTDPLSSWGSLPLRLLPVILSSLLLAEPPSSERTHVNRQFWGEAHLALRINRWQSPLLRLSILGRQFASLTALPSWKYLDDSWETGTFYCWPHEFYDFWWGITAMKYFASFWDFYISKSLNHKMVKNKTVNDSST